MKSIQSHFPKGGCTSGCLGSALLLGAVAALFLFPALAAAQEAPAVPPELAGQPVSQWKLNTVTFFFIIQVLGRAFTALKSGGGLTGVYRSIVFGSATAGPQPPAPARPGSLAGTITLACGALLLTGCAGVPTTRITADLSKHRVTIDAPKDATLRGFDLSRDTNGDLHVKFQEYRARMNPDVLEAQTSREAAQWEGLKQLSGEVVERAIKAGGKAVVP